MELKTHQACYEVKIRQIKSVESLCLKMHALIWVTLIQREDNVYTISLNEDAIDDFENIEPWSSPRNEEIRRISFGGTIETDNGPFGYFLSCHWVVIKSICSDWRSKPRSKKILKVMAGWSKLKASEDVLMMRTKTTWTMKTKMTRMMTTKTMTTTRTKKRKTRINLKINRRLYFIPLLVNVIAVMMAFRMIPETQQPPCKYVPDFSFHHFIFGSETETQDFLNLHLYLSFSWSLLSPC